MSRAEDVARACADALYGQDLASQALGITVEQVGPGRAVVRMSVGPAMVNGHGIAHGGYVFLLADTAFAFACNSYDQRAVAAWAEIHFLAPVHQGEVLLARAAERHRSGRNGLYDITVSRLEDPATTGGPEQVVAEFRGRSRSTGGALLGPGGRRAHPDGGP